MKTILTLIIMSACLSAGGQDLPRTFIFSELQAYDEATGYGFDRLPAPVPDYTEPFYFSIRVPDGNYKVTVRLGSHTRDGATTVRGESRRLFVDNLATRKGEFTDVVFVINKRSTLISGDRHVRIKEREKTKLNWDDKLTFELNGDSPAVESITIEPADQSTITVFLCGDSTVTDQENEPWASWGQMFPWFFNEHIAVANYSESGESANTFIAARRLEKALSQMKEGDYLFIEFGHNDQKQKGEGKGPYESYTDNLKKIIDQTRAKGGIPVLVTPTYRRRFDNDGNAVNSLGEFPDAVRLLAQKEDVALIDLHKMTGTLIEALGPAASKKAYVHYPIGSIPGLERNLADDTHFSTYGGNQIAKCVAQAIKTALPELARHLNPGFSYDPASPDDPAAFVWHLTPFVETEKPDGD